MPKRKVPLKEGAESFGRRLARLRQAAGYSQREFAAETGISQRMVAYYEKETAHAPAHLLPILKLGTFPIFRGGRDVRDARELDSWMRHIWLKVVKKEYDNGKILEESNLHSTAYPAPLKTLFFRTRM